MKEKIKIEGEENINPKQRHQLKKISERNFDKLNKKYELERVEIKIKDYKEEGKEKEFSINLRGYIGSRKYEVDSAPSYSKWRLSRKNWIFTRVLLDSFKKLDQVLKNTFKEKY